MKSRPLLLATLGCLLVAFAGCGKNLAKELSEYPYYVAHLNKMWDVTRTAMHSSKPDKLQYLHILHFALNEARYAVQQNYHKPNRDAVVAKFDGLAAAFRAQADQKCTLEAHDIVLRPGAKVEDLVQIVDKTYQDYQQILQLIQD